MPDNKLKDNEIIKALECCVFDQNCSKCPHYNNGKQTRECLEVSIKGAINLINRLQAKVIKEQNKNSKLRNERNHLQAKAYKECIEKVKERLAVYSFTSNSTAELLSYASYKRMVAVPVFLPFILSL